MSDITLNPTKIIFILDQQPILRNNIQIELILEVLRKIIFYYYKINRNIMWAYRFFDSTAKYTFNSFRKFYSVSEPLDIIKKEYEAHLSKYTPPTTIETATSSIFQVLKEALGDFSWKDCETSFLEQDDRQHHLFILTDSLYNIQNNDLDSFKTGMNTMKTLMMRSLCSAYENCSVSISLIDNILTDSVDIECKDEIATAVEHEYQQCLNLFSGKYINLKDLSEDYNLYGHSFRAEFRQLLPPSSKTSIKKMVYWTGELITPDTTILGCYRISPRTADSPNLFEHMAHIRIRRVVHKSEIPLRLTVSTNKQNNQYILSPMHDNFNCIIEPLLNQLFNSCCVIIADIISTDEYTQPLPPLLIEPHTRLSAAVIALNEDYEFQTPQQYTPEPLPFYDFNYDDISDDENDIEDTFTTDINEEDIPDDDLFSNYGDVDYEYPVEPFSIQSEDPKPNQEEDEDSDIEVPLADNLDTFGELLEEIYYELLYTNNYSTELVLHYIDAWISQLENADYSKEDIVSRMLPLSLSGLKIDKKHPLIMNYNQYIDNTVIKEKEQAYVEAWWNEINQDTNKVVPNSTELWLHTLKEREARFQTILFSYITRLTEDRFIPRFKNTPSELAKECFIKLAFIHATYAIREFLNCVDNEKENKEESERDPCDLDDLIFTNMLEKSFADLTQLVEEFRDVEGLNDSFSPPPTPPIMRPQVMSEEEEDIRQKRPKRTLAEALNNEEEEKKQKKQKMNIEDTSSQKSDSLAVGGANTKYINSLLKRSVSIPTASTVIQPKYTPKKIIKKPTVDIKPSSQSSSNGMRDFTQANNVTIRKPAVPIDVTPRTSFTRALGYDLFEIYGISPPRNEPEPSKNIALNAENTSPGLLSQKTYEQAKIGRNLQSTFEKMVNEKEDKEKKTTARSLDNLFNNTPSLNMESSGEEDDSDTIPY